MGRSSATSKPLRPTILAVVVVVLLALGAAWFQQRDSGSDTSSVTSTVASPSASDGPSYGQGPDDTSTRHGTDPDSGLPWISESDLPAEARTTLGLIDDGGPFPYPDKDGSYFGNFEGILPDEPSGYYAEYTVPTPGSSDRGARRIVTGAGGEFYYTDDHYESFSRIDR